MGHTVISYHKGKAVNRAPMYFEGPVNGSCSQIRYAFIDSGSDRYCTERLITGLALKSDINVTVP